MSIINSKGLRTHPWFTPTYFTDKICCLSIFIKTSRTCNADILSTFDGSRQFILKSLLMQCKPQLRTLLPVKCFCKINKSNVKTSISSGQVYLNYWLETDNIDNKWIVWSGACMRLVNTKLFPKLPLIDGCCNGGCNWDLGMTNALVSRMETQSYKMIQTEKKG